MLLSVTVDFPDDVCKGPYDADRLDQMMSMIAATGAKRVHWIYYGEVALVTPTGEHRERQVFGQRYGVPANIEFRWRRWLESGWVDSAYVRTSWFEAAEDPLGGATARSRLETVLQDPVVAEMLAVSARARVPVVLNGYIGRAIGLSEYRDDHKRVTRDGRFAGFDVYEFFDLAQYSDGALVGRRHLHLPPTPGGINSPRLPTTRVEEARSRCTRREFPGIFRASAGG